jgi:hypothetical protein
MSKLFETSDKYDTLLDLKRVIAVQRQEREPFEADANTYVPSKQGCYWIGVYLTGRVNPIELEYPFDSTGRVNWEADFRSLKRGRGPL